MPAAVETFGNIAAFASLREPAWHGLGTVFDSPVTTEQMLSLSHLANWNVHSVSGEDFQPGVGWAAPTNFVVRDNPFHDGMDVLGVSGDRYEIFSNEETFAIGDDFTNGRRRWETAGSIKGGTRVFASMVDFDDIVLDPNGQADTIRKYFLLVNSFDGSSNLILKKCNMRVVCKNTLNVALAEAGAEFKIRHTRNMRDRLAEAQQALGYLDTYDEAFETAAKQMIEAEVTDNEFWEVVKDLYPEPEKDVKGTVKKWTTKTDAIWDVWNGSTRSMKGLDRNAWRAFNALTEANQWVNRQVRSGKTENFLAAGAGFDNLTNDFRNKAFARTMALV